MSTGYLRHVHFWIRHSVEIPFLDLCRFRLEQDGIKVTVAEPDLLQNKESWTKEKAAGILYVTDDAMLLEDLLKKEISVLWYQDGNGIKVKDSFVHAPYVIEGLEDADVEYFERIYRRFQKIPWDILETERLIVRESTLKDLDSFYEIYKDKSITRFMEDLFEDREEEANYLKSYIETCYRFFETGIFTVLEKESGKVIGRAGLEVREEYEGLELGFLIGKAYQEKGYATEVCKALLAYASEYFPDEEVHAFVEEKNEISIHLLEKLGFLYQKKQTVMTCKEGEKEYLAYLLPT